MITAPLPLLNWGSFGSRHPEIRNIPEGKDSTLNPNPKENTNIPTARTTVIVVDDNKDAADSLTELFRILGYETFTAYNGTDGLALYQNMHPRFVFLDIAMPDMSGYEVIGHMLTNEAPDTVFIAVTGFGQENDKLRSHEAGFDYHLTKPINLAEMREILSKHS